MPLDYSTADIATDRLAGSRGFCQSLTRSLWEVQVPVYALTKYKDIKLSEIQANMMKGAAILTKVVQTSAELEVSLKGQ